MINLLDHQTAQSAHKLKWNKTATYFFKFRKSQKSSQHSHLSFYECFLFCIFPTLQMNLQSVGVLLSIVANEELLILLKRSLNHFSLRLNKNGNPYLIMSEWTFSDWTCLFVFFSRSFQTFRWGDTIFLQRVSISI